MAYDALVIDGLEPLGQYSQATITATARLLHISGQVSMDADTVLGVGDPDVQAAEVIDRLGRVLSAAGASWADVCLLRAYATSLEAARAFAKARRGVLRDPPPASTTLIVAGLIHPDLVIEVEATAVLDAEGSRHG